MSEVVVRIADHNDLKNLDKVFPAQDKNTKHGFGFNQLSFQSLLLRGSHMVFVAEKESKILAAAIFCVVDAGTTLVHRNIFIRHSSGVNSSLSTSLLEKMYKHVEPKFPRLRRERFVSSCEAMTQMLLGKETNHRVSDIKKLKERGPFNKVFEIHRKDIEVPGGISFGRILDKLARECTLVPLSKKQAGKYILENVSTFQSHTIIMDDVPYYVQLSDSDAFFDDTECLLGEKGSESEESDIFHLKVREQELNPSGRNSPSRRSSSHLISVLDSLHTSLRCMNGTLRGLHDSLLASMPKSFSHGRQLSSSNNLTNYWETMIYTDDAKVFRAHIIEQLRAAVLRVKGRFVFRLSFSGNLMEVAIKVLKDELGLKILHDADDSVVVYERLIQLPLENGV